MPIDTATVDSVVGSLRSRRWESLEELADTIATSLSAIGKMQSEKRGLRDKSIVNVEGGTLIATDDPSVGRNSISMQTPQLMFMRKHGAVAMRHQVRNDVTMRTVPAIVRAINGTTLTVSRIGEFPKIVTDSSTGQNAGGNPLNDLTEGPDYNAEVNGTIDIEMPTGMVAPSVNESILITISTQEEKRTIWTEINRKNQVRVFSRPVSEVAAVVGGTYVPETCSPFVHDEFGFYESSSSPAGDWVVQPDVGEAYAGRPYCVITLSRAVGSNGDTLDRAAGDFVYYHVGVLPSTGIASFSGVTWDYVASSNEFYIYNTPTNPNWYWCLLVGCQVQGQEVNFGEFPFANIDGFPDLTFNIIDSNFPVPL